MLAEQAKNGATLGRALAMKAGKWSARIDLIHENTASLTRKKWAWKCFAGWTPASR